MNLRVGVENLVCPVVQLALGRTLVHQGGRTQRRGSTYYVEGKAGESRGEVAGGRRKGGREGNHLSRHRPAGSPGRKKGMHREEQEGGSQSQKRVGGGRTRKRPGGGRVRSRSARRVQGRLGPEERQGNMAAVRARGNPDKQEEAEKKRSRGRGGLAIRRGKEGYAIRVRAERRRRTLRGGS